MGISVIGGATGAAPSKIQRIKIIKSTLSFTTPSDVSEIEILLCGGGGQGSLNAGGNGSAVWEVLQVAPSTSYTVTIGGAGGTSSFGSLISVSAVSANNMGGSGGTLIESQVVGPLTFQHNQMAYAYARVGGGSEGGVGIWGFGGGGGGRGYGEKIGQNGGGNAGAPGKVNTGGGGGANSQLGGSGIAVLKYWSAV